MKIDRSNYEIWLIDWLDGNLSGTDIEELQLFLKKNPDLNDEVEELNTVRLSSLTDSYSLKNQLKKTTADLTGAHIEYLSAAYLEGDLSSYQKNAFRRLLTYLKPERIHLESICLLVIINQLNWMIIFLL